MPSLETYVLLEQHEQQAEVYGRGPEGLYQTLEATDSLTIPCPEVTLSLADMYQNAPLLPPDEPLARPRL